MGVIQGSINQLIGVTFGAAKLTGLDEASKLKKAEKITSKQLGVVEGEQNKLDERFKEATKAVENTTENNKPALNLINAMYSADDEAAVQNETRANDLVKKQIDIAEKQFELKPTSEQLQKINDLKDQQAAGLYHSNYADQYRQTLNTAYERFNKQAAQKIKQKESFKDLRKSAILDKHGTPIETNLPLKKEKK